jgi:hypothetical protein
MKEKNKKVLLSGIRQFYYTPNNRYVFVLGEIKEKNSVLFLLILYLHKFCRNTKEKERYGMFFFFAWCILT